MGVGVTVSFLLMPRGAWSRFLLQSSLLEPETNEGQTRFAGEQFGPGGCAERVARRLRLADEWAADSSQHKDCGAVLVPVGQRRALQRAREARSFEGFPAPPARPPLLGCRENKGRNACLRQLFTRRGTKNIGGH